jgi:hypothetical protein
MDIVVQPMQRLTKYSLLLKAIHRNTENEEHRDSLAAMVSALQIVNLWKHNRLFYMLAGQWINRTEPGWTRCQIDRQAAKHAHPGNRSQKSSQKKITFLER